MRRLTGRESALLIILLLLILGSGYYLWFYVPVTEKQNSLEEQIQEARSQIQADRVRIAHMEEMEQKLEELFAAGPEPVSMAPFDNARNVMLRLNTVLSDTEDYSLNFTSVDESAEEGIVRRKISLNFRSSGYQSARRILQRLHDIPYRCMLDDLNVTIRKEAEGSSFDADLWWLEEGKKLPKKKRKKKADIEFKETVNVAATLVFFEYIG